jgi:hypothetical protein
MHIKRIWSSSLLLHARHESDASSNWFLNSQSLHPVGSWKPDALAHVTQSRNRKHAIRYEQANRTFWPLTADTSHRQTLGRFPGCWLSQLGQIHVFLSHHPRTPPIRRLNLLPRKRALCSRAYRQVEIGAATAKAATARFVPDSSPTPCFLEQANKV